MNLNTAEYSEELYWAAFRYVAGEMSDIESDEFEQRLADDADLCATVAEVSALVLSVAAVRSVDASATEPDRPVTLVTPARTSGKRAAGSVSRAAAILATVGCIALALLAAGRFRDDAGNVQVGDAGVIDAETLVLAWADNRPVEVPNFELVADDSFSDELAVPDWMLAGVSLAELENSEHSDMPADQVLPDDMDFF